ncbi:MAG: erythromycin esterase family protein [Bacteroidota bacterium]
MPLFLLCLLLAISACDSSPEPEVLPFENCSFSETEQDVVSALDAGEANPFEWQDGEAPDPQLDPLVEYLRETPIVGMGEATHGTADFYRFKNQLFRTLVTEAGFKAVVFEIPWGNALVVNDYVRNGVGTAEAVVGQTYYWTYDTQEVIDLVQWMHDYNQDLPEEDKIWFLGCDVQGPDFGAEITRLRGYLESVDPDAVADLIDNYDQLPQSDLFDYYLVSEEVHSANQIGTQLVYDHLVDQEVAYTNRSSALSYQIALMAAHLIRERERIYRTSDYGEPRDELMAVYTEWWQGILAEDSKIAVWAHNRHVMNAASIGQNWMGTYLAQRVGEDYKALGFSFSRGRFNAFLANESGGFQASVRAQAIDQTGCNTINALLEKVEANQFFLIKDELSLPVSSYFQLPRPFTQMGAGFNPEYIGNYTQDLPLLRLYDVLVHFDNTSPSILR